MKCAPEERGHGTDISSYWQYYTQLQRSIQCAEAGTQRTAKADGVKHHREAHLCVHVLCWAGLCWGAAWGWYGLPVVMLARQVGGRPFF